MNNKHHHVCPVVLARSLDNRIRRWLQPPRKMLEPYIQDGMTVLDLGCGPGFFTIEIARMVGPSGRVIAADLQEGMLQKIKNKITGTELEKRIKLHKSEETGIGVTEKVDFILAFYMIHEVPDQEGLFKQITSLLKPNGRLLMVEPPFHVSTAAFEGTIDKAQRMGLKMVNRPKMLFSRAALMQKD
jgi:ubiquinone/menaquinone biosynthesis C-methylase UbiE